MHEPESVYENETQEILCDFEIRTDHLIPARRPDLLFINKRKIFCPREDLAAPINHRVKMKEKEKRNKHLDITRRLKKQWNVRVTVIPIVVGTLRKVLKNAENELEEYKIRGRIETIQTATLSRLARIL